MGSSTPYIPAEEHRAELLRRHHVPIIVTSRRASRNSRRNQNNTDQTTQDPSEELGQYQDQSGSLDEIRFSRNIVGCRCTPNSKRKPKKKANTGSSPAKPRKVTPLSCCSGKKCACAMNELGCHTGVCDCAEFACKNKFGRRQLNIDRVELNRIRVLQPELYEEIVKQRQAEEERSKPTKKKAPTKSKANTTSEEVVVPTNGTTISPAMPTVV